ncbi:MAG: nucleotide sugar dehydrogenase [Bacteroidota bacterium]
MKEKIKIAVIGLGYVGLPIAQLFATKYPVVGFDINTKRIGELINGIDSTFEVDNYELKKAIKTSPDSKNGLYLTNTIESLGDCNYYIVTVPTPVTSNNIPDLTSLYKASISIAKVLKKGDIVIYESTVYPGATEEECVPRLEECSGLKFNTDFFVGYSPERINPGDKQHTVDKILKVTSGSNPEIAQKVDFLYKSVITAGTYMAPSIKIAEAAKVIENSQRDINIAFVNELAKIFNLMDIDTQEVLKAANTKWNFLPFTPGLVGGHCIGVDPYYLAKKSQEYGYHPEIILAGRRMNDGMGNYVSSEIIKLMARKDIKLNGSNILVLGITFKENCPDVRNSKVIDLIDNLKSYGADVSVYDPLADKNEVIKEFKLEILNLRPKNNFDAVVLAVAHKEFLELNLRSLLKENGVLYDVKGVLKGRVDGRL